MGVTVEAICDEAVEKMRSLGYKASTMGQNRKMFSYLAEFAGHGDYAEEIGKRWLGERRPDGKGYCANYLGAKRRVVSIADAFLATGSIDLTCRSYADPQPRPRSGGLLALLADYESYGVERGLAEGTRNYYLRLAREFLLYSESEGASCAEELTPAAVCGFMAAICRRWRGTDGRHIVTNFRPFLKYLGRGELLDALRLASPVRRHPIMETLKPEDEEAVARACCNGLVSAKDAAITLLALTTGMRACDIIGLKLGDIDWRSSSITIIQQKTGSPLSVPMAAAVQSALAGYILNHRPESDRPNVFLRDKAPHAPFSDHSAIYSATRRVLKKAGIEGGGSLLLRRSAASRMLRSGASLPVISAVLGHASPETTNGYMEANEDAMRSCVLPLPKAVRP